MDKKNKRCNIISNEIKSSNWLTVIPMKEYNCILNKQEIWDTIRMMYGWPVQGLPVKQTCGKCLDIQNPISWKKEDLQLCNIMKLVICATPIWAVQRCETKTLLILIQEKETLKKDRQKRITKSDWMLALKDFRWVAWPQFLM